jgi:hypothetical protein
MAGRSSGPFNMPASGIAPSTASGRLKNAFVRLVEKSADAIGRLLPLFGAHPAFVQERSAPIGIGELRDEAVPGNYVLYGWGIGDILHTCLCLGNGLLFCGGRSERSRAVRSMGPSAVSAEAAIRAAFRKYPVGKVTATVSP